MMAFLYVNLVLVLLVVNFQNSYAANIIPIKYGEVLLELFWTTNLLRTAHAAKFSLIMYPVFM